jgi:type IV pilus assembly protein PilC
MNKFSYKAKDEKGKLVTGVVEAANEKQAIQLLRARKLLVISLSPKKEASLLKIKAFQRIKMDDKVNFSRQLATMVTAGLPLTEALSVLETQASPAMKPVISEILRQVEGGGNLADALEKHPQAFDQIYVALVRAGEAAGILDKILNRLAKNLEKERDFQSKVKGAMVYPAIIVTGMVIVALIMIIFVIPRLTVLYEEFEAELPFITKALLSVSKFLSSFWWLGISLFAGFLYLLRLLSRSPGLKKRYDEIYFRLPILGNLRRQIMLTEFTRTLGLLVGAGILIVEALNIVQKSMGSPLYEEALGKAMKQVERGYPLATALAQTEIFPPLLPQMVAVGEQTGKVDEVLGKISAYFEQEAATLVKGLTTALEPIILIVLGVGVGFLIVAVIMPIYNLTSQF